MSDMVDEELVDDELAGDEPPELSEGARNGLLQSSPEGLASTQQGFAAFRAVVRAMFDWLVTEVEEEREGALEEQDRRDLGRLARRLAVADGPTISDPEALARTGS